MPRQTAILEALQDHGAVLGRNLLEYSGWRTRGSETFAPKVSVNHHTAGPRTGVFPSLPILVNGRGQPGDPDYLPPPLANAGLDRYNGGHSPRLHLLAAGRANHAGAGGWKGYSGNSTAWGLEVEHSGTSAEPVTDEQWEMMYLWHAAAIDVSGTDASHVCQHFEWAPTRKIDFVKTITDPAAFRQHVADQGDDMATAPYSLWKFNGRSEVWRVDASGQSRAHVNTPAALNIDRFFLGLGGFNNGVNITGAQSDANDQLWEWLESIPVNTSDPGEVAVIAKATAAAVVAALPPSSGGGGPTLAQIEAACRTAVNAELGFLKPGQ